MGGSAILQNLNQSNEYGQHKRTDEVESDKENYDYKNVQMSKMNHLSKLSGQGFAQHSQYSMQAQWNQFDNSAKLQKNQLQMNNKHGAH